MHSRPTGRQARPGNKAQPGREASSQLLGRCACGYYPRSHHCCLFDGLDDPAFSRKLAQHPYHRGFDSIVDPDVGDCAEFVGREHQHNDAGGLALAVGILVDDATVTIENIERFSKKGIRSGERFLKAPRKSRSPRLFPHSVFASCLCRCFSWPAFRGFCSFRLRKRLCSPCLRLTPFPGP